MALDTSEYVRAIKPLNILQVSDREVLENFIAGYSHLAFSGAAVFSKTCEGFPKEDADIDCATAGGSDAPSWYHPFCHYYRLECGQNGQCEVFDRVITRKYYTGDYTRPVLYRCHRHLWDMTYPLRVGGNLVGVLFGGQIIVKEENVDWRELLFDMFLEVKNLFTSMGTGSWIYNSSNGKPK